MVRGSVACEVAPVSPDTTTMMRASHLSTSRGSRSHFGRGVHAIDSLMGLRQLHGRHAERTIGILAHLNVCSTTTIITPASAEMGMKSSTGYATIVHSITPSAVTVGARRPRPPLRQLMVESPIIASPPMPPSRPETRLARPIDQTIEGVCAGVLTYEVTTSVVIRPCTTPATTRRTRRGRSNRRSVREISGR